MQATPRDENEAANSSELLVSSDSSAGKSTSAGIGGGVGVSAPPSVQDGEHVPSRDLLKEEGGVISSTSGEQVSCDATADLPQIDARQASPQRTNKPLHEVEPQEVESKNDSALSIRQPPSPSAEERNVVAGQTASCSSKKMAPNSTENEASSLPKSSQTASPPVENCLAHTSDASEPDADDATHKQASMCSTTKAVVTPQERSPITRLSMSTVTNVASSDPLPSTLNPSPSSVTLKPRPVNITDSRRANPTQATGVAVSSIVSGRLATSNKSVSRGNELSPTTQRNSIAPKRASALLAYPPLSPQCYGRPRSNSVPNSPPTSLLVAAAASAAGAIKAPKSSQQNNKTNLPLRRGKWTVEEEAYVARVILEFNSGFLNAPAGTTLRTYLSEKLHCDPMRITKKFTGDSCIGKRVFHPAVRCANNAAAIDKAQAELDSLERRWRRRLEMQQKESAKKAAASAAAAAAAAATTSRHHLHTNVTNLQPSIVPSPQERTPVNAVVASAQPPKQNIATQTASWLDRAQALLSSKPSGTACLPNSDKQQMKEVKRLIDEVPTIQHSTSLPCVSENFTACKRKVSVEDQELRPSHSSSSLARPALYTPPPASQQAMQRRGSLVSQSTNPLPPEYSGLKQPEEHSQDKRARRCHSASNLSSLSSDAAEAKDAEALVGFLNTVRAAAAASSSGDTSKH